MSTIETTYIITVIESDKNAGEYYPKEYTINITETAEQTKITKEALLKIREWIGEIDDFEYLAEEQQELFENLDSQLEDFLIEYWTDLKTIIIKNE